MKLLLLDGYNIIHKVPEIAAQLNSSLEKARQCLANFIMTWKKQHAYNGKICIVFDGMSNGASNSASLCGIKCLYTSTKQEADDRIISMVRNAAEAKAITVISDDNYIANNCRAHGALIRSVQFLLQAPKSKTSQPDKNIDPATKKDINDFLKKEWGI